MKVYKYRFIEYVGEEDENWVRISANCTYRGVNLQLGDEVELLSARTCVVPGCYWQELETSHCKVVENGDGDGDNYEALPPELGFVQDGECKGAALSAVDAAVRLYSDVPLEVEIKDFLPFSKWVDKSHLEGIKLKEEDKIDILIHDERENNIGEDNVYAIIEGKISSYKNRDGNIELFLETHPNPFGSHSFEKIFKYCDCSIRIAKD